MWTAGAYHSVNKSRTAIDNEDPQETPFNQKTNTLESTVSLKINMYLSLEVIYINPVQNSNEKQRAITNKNEFPSTFLRTQR